MVKTLASQLTVDGSQHLGHGSKASYFRAVIRWFALA